MQKWDEPRVVRLDALPDVLGMCGVGASVTPTCSMGHKATSCTQGSAINQPV